MTFHGPSGPTEVFVRNGTCKADGPAKTRGASHCKEMKTKDAEDFMLNYWVESMMNIEKEEKCPRRSQT